MQNAVHSETLTSRFYRLLIEGTIMGGNRWPSKLFYPLFPGLSYRDPFSGISK